tara:strand:+ start:605 stop:955 length:351 start_codon:yes stop_codon:yes gene_type:complete
MSVEQTPMARRRTLRGIQWLLISVVVVFSLSSCMSATTAGFMCYNSVSGCKGRELDILVTAPVGIAVDAGLVYLMLHAGSPTLYGMGQVYGAINTGLVIYALLLMPFAIVDAVTEE